MAGCAGPLVVLVVAEVSLNFLLEPSKGVEGAVVVMMMLVTAQQQRLKILAVDGQSFLQSSIW
jgi:hypothetical protein